MNEIRQVLLIPICAFFVFWVLIGGLCLADYRGLVPSAYKSIRRNFDIKHPGLNRKITLGTFILCTVVFLFLLSSYGMDFVEGKVDMIEGKVVDTQRSKALIYSSIILDNGKTYSNWLNTVDLAPQQEYEIYYTPRSETIIRVVEK